MKKAKKQAGSEFTDFGSRIMKSTFEMKNRIFFLLTCWKQCRPSCWLSKRMTP